MDFEIEKYLAQFTQLLIAQKGDWPATDVTSVSGLSELQRRSMACVAGYQVYEQLKEHREASVTLTIAPNGDISFF